MTGWRYEQTNNPVSAFSDELSLARTKKKTFLAQIERLISRDEWVALTQPRYYKGERGNKPFALELMLRIFVLRNLYDLADEADSEEDHDCGFRHHRGSNLYQEQGKER